jgi:hypothetical protein
MVKNDFFISKGGSAMKQRFAIMIGLFAVLALAAMTVVVQGAAPPGEALEYKVLSINPENWVVTAKETATGNVVKFRLPPTVFKGKTFDADLGKLSKGQRFSVRGPRNARLNNLILEKPVPGAGPPRRLGRRIDKLRAQPSAPLAWEILHVDARKWIVTAKNRQTQKVAKFQAHPEAFIGFLFRANLKGIKRGQGFAIVTPNNQPINNVCTLLELKK